MNEAIMKAAGFGAAVELVKQGICPFCKKRVFTSELRNDIERNEFKISGLCHSCQEQFFDEDGALKTGS